VIDNLLTIGGIIAAIVAAIGFSRWTGKRQARREVKKEMELLTAEDALEQERERVARDEKINGAADLAALARNSGLVRPGDAP
jgi:type II secretory pathway pseudopilin PulG